MNNTIFYLEGNIGAGKSTLIQRLKNESFTDECLFMTETVSNWPSLVSIYLFFFDL